MYVYVFEQSGETIQFEFTRANFYYPCNIKKARVDVWEAKETSTVHITKLSSGTCFPSELSQATSHTKEFIYLSIFDIAR